ncbi:hypothetical protein [Dongia rigui]|uniref:Strictosidine synthase conserved region domain-containing protein n=1 Tax=Dongia rigui TaxID=940149 RepID=A0ABU5E074_9PROT|nr:hypothetical protein [Dongia rigui]MDY0872585.1 hypothetical protein [Dongia rigui]
MIFDPILDLFRGKAVTIAPLDGAFRPNTALEEANLAQAVAQPDNLIVHGGRLLFSSGSDLFTFTPGGTPAIQRSFGAPISALAASPGGHLAVALDDGQLFVADREITLPQGVACITAMSFGDDTSLYLCNGSATHRPGDWALDLMEKNSSGSLWRLDPATGAAVSLADNLAFPNGVLVDGQSVIVAESWRHRLLRLTGGTVTPLLEKLPGYPARLAPASGGGAWLSLFAPRNRLVEFVLQEDAYRRDMIAQVPRPYWIAPSLASGASFLEPLQCGGIKTMGIHKPWSPSRSYGLVARLDNAFRPVASYHSRANGARHGVTSVAEYGGYLWVGSKGGNALLSLSQKG